jgi:hypothetical protein
MPLRSLPSHVRRPLVAWLAGALAIAGPATACTRPADPSAPTNATATTSTGSGNSNGTVSAIPPTTSPPISSAPDDDQLAIQAVERYYAAFNAALKSLKTDQMRKEFFPGCLICEQDADTIDSVALQGRTHSGGDVKLGSPSVTNRQPTRIVVQANVVAERLILKDAAGRIVKEEPQVTTIKSFFIAKASGRWILEGMT